MTCRPGRYVEAARALGLQHLRIAFRHVMPNTVGPFIVLMTAQLGSAILAGRAARDGGAWKFAREVQAGNLHINWGPQWRADLMPYGGLKESGFGKEGPDYAIEEMTELKMVVFHLSG